MSYRPVGQPNVGLERKLESVKTAEATAKLSFLERAQLASGDAWSPDPKNPPLYLDLPKKVAQPDILAKWAPNGPLDFIDQYIPKLRRYNKIAIDVGDQDNLLPDTAKLHDVLDRHSIPNTFEIYAGTHTSAVADRFQNQVTPFFSKHLCFQTSCQQTASAKGVA